MYCQLPNGADINLANKGGYMTSKDLSIFNSLRPFSIGFDDMFDPVSYTHLTLPTIALV